MRRNRFCWAFRSSWALTATTVGLTPPSLQARVSCIAAKGPTTSVQLTMPTNGSSCRRHEGHTVRPPLKRIQDRFKHAPKKPWVVLLRRARA